MDTQPDSLLEITKVKHSFPKPGGGRHLVLDDIHLSLHEGEIVGLLGRSGSGKSTLLRLIAGLCLPTSGDVKYLGHKVTGPADGISMVFQGFALFPWLSVLENVQLGLEALGLAKKEIRSRALRAIDMIGLDGYEQAYPRELSGGMRQRVGFARALVVHPNIMLMDEAFSALDVLTAETLRTDFLDLWSEGQLPIKGVVLVTHNIEEAVIMCDRILVLSANPGRLVTEIKVNLPQPRDRLDPQFTQIVEKIYVELTTKLGGDRRTPLHTEHAPGVGIGTILPVVSTNRLSGFIETLASATYKGKANLHTIAPHLHLEINDLFPIAETLQMLHFALITGGHIELTDAGLLFASADVDKRKEIFARHLMAHIALAAHIRRVLDGRKSNKAPKSRFLDEIEDYMGASAAQQTLKTVISWGRYAEIFAYDDEDAVFSLENPS